MITNNLSTLKINKLTQAQYNRALSEGRINDNELYLTPDNSTIDIDLSNYVDLTSDQTISGNKTFTGSASFSGPVGNTQSSAGVYLGLDENSVPNANIAIASANTAAYIDMGTPNKDYGFRIIKWNNASGNYDAEFCYGEDGSGGASATIKVPRKSGTIALTSDIPNNYVDTSSDQDIGGNKTFTNGIKVRGSGTVLNNEGDAVTENVETTVNPTGIRMESYSTTNYYDFPTNSGTLAVVSYDKSSHTLTIKA